MKKQILVALRSENPLCEIMPYLDAVTRPNTTVVLLIPYYKVSRRLQAWGDSREKTHGAGETMSAWSSYPERESSEDEKKRLTELRVALTEQAMRKKGVEIVTDIYRGRLRKVIKGYMRNGEVHLIIGRKKFDVGFSGLLQKAPLLFGYLKNPDFSSWHCSLRGTGCQL